MDVFRQDGSILGPAPLLLPRKMPDTDRFRDPPPMILKSAGAALGIIDLAPPVVRDHAAVGDPQTGHVVNLRKVEKNRIGQFVRHLLRKDPPLRVVRLSIRKLFRRFAIVEVREDFPAWSLCMPDISRLARKGDREQRPVGREVVPIEEPGQCRFNSLPEGR